MLLHWGVVWYTEGTFTLVIMPAISKKAYVATVDMGYGHQRAVYPLADIAEGAIITANNYPGIPESDRRTWESTRLLYETISRLKPVPIIGDLAFGLMDYAQRIEPFYPRRDLSHHTMQLRQQFRMIRNGWGKDLVHRLNEKPLPLIVSFPTIAFFAEEHGYKGDIYCICTDTDINRAWAPLNPKHTRVKYLVPNHRVRERLKLYGVPGDNILVTGFPLPKENIGNNLSVLKQSLGCRISNLDPEGRYQKKFEHTITHNLGQRYCNLDARHPLSITFAVGGAGAQRDIGAAILESLHSFIDHGHIQLNLVAGIRQDVYRYYESVISSLHLSKQHTGHIHIIYASTKEEYFRQFNEMLKTTDVLWTKPSELSFYAGLGLPIIIAPTVGSQEEFNKDWLLSIGAGFMQEDPRYTHEWLFDWLKSGWLAEAAMNGFMNAPHNGAFHVEDIVLHGKKSEIEDIHLL